MTGTHAGRPLRRRAAIVTSAVALSAALSAGVVGAPVASAVPEDDWLQTSWMLNPNSGDTGGLLLDDWRTWDEAKYNLLRPALWQFNDRFVSLDHQVPLGGAGSTIGISLGERYRVQ